MSKPATYIVCDLVQMQVFQDEFVSDFNGLGWFKTDGGGNVLESQFAKDNLGNLVANQVHHNDRYQEAGTTAAKANYAANLASWNQFFKNSNSIILVPIEL